MGLFANGSDNTDLQMGSCCGVQGAGDHNEDDGNDSGEGCKDSYVILMSLMSQTAVGAATLTTRGSDSDKTALSERVKAKLGANFPAQDPVALGHLGLGYGGKIATLPPPRCFYLWLHIGGTSTSYTNTCQWTASHSSQDIHV